MKKHDFWKLLKTELSISANELFKYICGAFSGQEVLTRQSDKETWINE